MAETPDIQEHNNECIAEGLRADCLRRVKTGAMKSELDFFIGARAALMRCGLEEEAESLGLSIVLAIAGRSVTDPTQEEIDAKWAEGLEWCYTNARWQKAQH